MLARSSCSSRRDIRQLQRRIYAHHQVVVRSRELFDNESVDSPDKRRNVMRFSARRVTRSQARWPLNSISRTMLASD